MKKHLSKKHLSKRIMSLATAGIIGLSSMSMSSVVASAAGTTNYNGKIQIDVVDSSVYGADRTDTNINNSMLVPLGGVIGGAAPSSVFKQYWNNSLTNRDFLYTAQGLATFDTRHIVVYDITLSDGSKLAPNNNGRYTIAYLDEQERQDHISGYEGMFRIGRNGGILKKKINGSGVLGPVKAYDTKTDEEIKQFYETPEDLYYETPEDLYDDHYYVLMNSDLKGDIEYGYSASTDDVNSVAWELIFQWRDNEDIKLSYDNQVSSESTLGIPLHNDAYRGSFTFNVYDKDLQKYSGQNGANITGSKYVVYNISTTATSNDDPNQIAWKNDGTSPAGYVVTDRNLDGVLSPVESTSYVPAYTEADIISAYTNYLVECNGDEEYNGKYNSKLVDGEFIIGNNSNGKPIIPALVLEPDANGVVSAGSYGLPSGNYIILQVQAGKGYYLDEDFRPIVSMGVWTDDFTESDTHGHQRTAYGNAYYHEIANGYKKTILNLQSHSNLGATPTKSPVAFCPLRKTTDLSTIVDTGYYIGSSGTLRKNGISESELAYGVKYTADSVGASGGRYVMNSEDVRMKPVVGTNRFTVQNAVIRSAFYINMADSDDVLNPIADVNLADNGDYLIIPQGNGNLNGAEFEVTPKDTTKPLRLYSTGVTLDPGKSYKYVVENGALIIPKDDLAYGVYNIKQVTTGAGYELNDWSIAQILVGAEDVFVCAFEDQFDDAGNCTGDSAIVGQYDINGKVHLPNNLISGGEIYSLKSDTAPSGTTVDLSVYNISNQYVYVDKDNNGTEERFETYQYTYKNQIAGKSLSHENLLKIVSNWTPCKTINIEVGKTINYEDTLPYGTYLVVVTGVPAGYNVTGNYMGVDTITSKTDDVRFETKIDNIAALPVIDTWFTDAQTNIDSIAIKNRVFLQDIVKIENLVGGEDYTIYGAIIDKSTGNLLQQGAVAFANGTAYKATDIGNTTGVNSRAAEVLLNDGARFISWSDEYMAWILEVRDYATTIGNQTLVNYCDTAIRNGNNITSVKFHEDKSRITATLKYLARGEVSADLDLEGKLEVTVNFDAMDTRAMEGKTFVAYEYVCDSIGAPVVDALAANTTGELLAALDTVLIASHRDISDEDQTVYLPTLDIEAYASYTKSKTIDPSETIEGFVTYGNIEPGNKYAVEAWLVDAYGMKVSFKDDNGNTVTKLRDEFTAFASTGDAVFKFNGLDMVQYNNQRLTVYATLYRREANQLNAMTDYWLIEKGDAASMGYDITDPEPGKNQVDVVAPTVKTTLSDNYGRKTVNFDRKVSLKDTVSYKGLVVGGVYNSKLTLVNSDGTVLCDDEGNELIAEHKFTATKSDMTIEIPISFMGKTLRGLDIIAYNDLYRQTPDKIAVVAEEHNPLAVDQTITATGEAYKITVSTVATNPENNTHVVNVSNSAAASDSVTIRNLEPATQYIAKTELAYASTGKVIKQFMPIETVFTTDLDGTAKFNVPFTINSLVLKGQTLVVYQTIYDITGENIVTIHADMYDTNQMLMVPEIDTVATANDGISKKIVPIEKEENLTNDPNGPKETKYYTEVMDTIYYKNLIPGNMYNIITEVVTRDGKASLGKITSEFTPATEAGSTYVYIDLDVTSYRGKQLVVYETITDAYTGKEIITHKDLADLDQTVEIMGDIPEETEDPEDPENPDDPEKPDDPNNPNKPSDPDDNKPSDPSDPDDTTPGKGTDIDTGVAEQYGLFFAIGGGVLLLAGALIGLLIYRRRKDQ